MTDSRSSHGSSGAVEEKLLSLNARWAAEGGPFDGEWVSEVLALMPRQDTRDVAATPGEPVAYLYEVNMGGGFWSQRYSDAKPAGNEWQQNIRPLYLDVVAQATIAPIPSPDLEKIAGMNLLALAAGLEDNLCHRHCACPRDDGPKDCIQERAASVLRAVAGQAVSSTQSGDGK